MAKFEYSIRSKDETKPGVKSAQDGLKGLEGSMKSINKVAATLMGAGAVAGVMMALRKMAQAANEAEKAFAAMHPETQKAAGSLADWNTAMKNMQAEGGGIVANVLTPIRKAILDIIDPAHEAKLALQEMTDTASGWDKYTSATTKAARAIRDATQALADAKKALPDMRNQLNEYQRMLKALGARPNFGARALQYQSSGYDSSYAQAKATADIANYDQSLKFLTEAIARLGGDIDNAEEAVVEIPKWIDENTKKTETIAKTLTASLKQIMYQGALTRGGEARADREAQGQEIARAQEYGSSSPLIPGFAGPAQAEAGPSKFQVVLEKLGSFLEPLMSQFQSLSMILNPVTTIMQAMWDALQPVVNQLLAPLVGILTIIGQLFAAVLTPALQILGPVIQWVSEIFVWLYNHAIVPLANGFIRLFNAIKALGQTIYYIITFQWGKIKNVSWDTNTGLLQEIDTNTLHNAGETAMENGGGGATSTYSAGRDIVVNVVINSQVITGDGGFRELALMLNREIQNAMALGVA